MISPQNDVEMKGHKKRVFEHSRYTVKSYCSLPIVFQKFKTNFISGMPSLECCYFGVFFMCLCGNVKSN